MSPTGPESVLRLARQFMESRVLLSGAELGLFTLLSREALSAEQVTARGGGDKRGMTILLDALVAMDLLDKRDGVYRCPPEAAALLASDAPGSVLPMVLHAANLWTRWSALTDLAGGPPEGRARADTGTSAFIGAMHVVAAPLAPGIVAAVQPGEARRLLDVGCGPGTYTLAFLEAAPALSATLFDRPEVIEIARERFVAAGALDRVNLVSGDFYTDALPPGHDLAFLSAIIHQNSADQNVELYRRIFDALDPGGRLVVRDHVLDPSRTHPRSGAMFAVNMLTVTPGGDSYTFEEIRVGLAAAGFERIRLLREDTLMDGLVEAFRP